MWTSSVCTQQYSSWQYAFGDPPIHRVGSHGSHQGGKNILSRQLTCLHQQEANFSTMCPITLDVN